MKWSSLPLKFSWPLGLPLLAVSLSLPAAAQEDEEVVLAPFTVTGSRIGRLDVETVAPVDVLRMADVQALGFSDLGEVLRWQSYHTGGAIVPADSAGGSTPGISSLNLRGIGVNQTLFLVNGRRAAPFASPGADGFQSIFDLNSIPLAAIESVEILKDGASAIYGSDAVAGVVNVRLRKHFQGLSTSVRVGDYFETGGLQKEFSAVAGTSIGKLSLMGVFDWSERDAVKARDLDYIANADNSSIAAKADPHYVEYDAQGNVVAERFGDPIGAGWFDTRSIYGAPGWVWSPDAPLPMYRSPEAGLLDRYATLADLEPYFFEPYWDYQEQAGFLPESSRYSFFTSAEYEFKRNLRAYTELSFVRSESKNDFGPTLADSGENGFTPGTVLTMPAEISWNVYDAAGNITDVFSADNPANPYDQDITWMGRRMLEVGSRINKVTSETPRVVLGLTGDFEMLGDRPWSWDVYGLYTRNAVSQVGRGEVTDDRLQQALYGLVPDGADGYRWDPDAPAHERVYFNYWGLNDPAMVDFLRVTNPTRSKFEIWAYEASLSGELYDLYAGPVGLAVGAEHRQEKLSHQVSDLNRSGMLLGGGETQDTTGSRDISAIYAELAIPVLERLEIQVAGRWENYSDEGFASRVRPKVGFKYRLTEWALLKGSYSESFKAPDLAYLYNTGNTRYTNSAYYDPLTGTTQYLQRRSAGNPDLNPETARSYFLGLDISAEQWIPGLSFGVERFHLKQRDMLARLSNAYDVGRILEGSALGEEPFTHIVVRNPDTNQILYLHDTYGNLSRARHTSWDFYAQYDREIFDLGRFLLYWKSTYLEEYGVQTRPEDRWTSYSTYMHPKWRHTAGISCHRGHWGASLSGLFIDERMRSIYDAATLGPDGIAQTADDGATYLHYTVKSQVVMNASVTYAGWWDTAVTVGVNNFLNDNPPVDPFEPVGVTAPLNYVEPAFWWVRMERNF